MRFRISSLIDPERPARSLYGWLAVILVFMALPVASELMASAFADVFGCRLVQSGEPCLIRGTDIGRLLSGMIAFGSARLLTLPAGLLLLIAWFIGVVTFLGKPADAQPARVS